MRQGKEVTVVHGGRLLMNDTYTDSFRNGLLKKLQGLGVKVVLEDRVDSFTPSEDGTVTTAKGKVINADLVVMHPPLHPPRHQTQ